MFIENLSLRNFKSVEQADFNFHKGVICFTGNNGEGKSTVLHALILLLFNTTYEGTLKDSIRWGCNRFDISVKFRHEGKSYKESISYSITSGGERVLEDLVTGEEWRNSTAIAKMAEIIDPEQARAAMVSMENEQNLITTTPSQRREYLKKVYSLEFKEELSRIADDISNADTDIQTAKGRLDVLKETEYPLKEEKTLPDSKVYESAKEELAVLEEEMKSLRAQSVKLDELRAKVEESNKSVSNLFYQKKSIEADISADKSAIASGTAKLTLLENTDYEVQLKEEKDSLTSDYEQRRAQLQTRCTEANSKLESLPKSVTRVNRAKLDELISKLAELNHEIKDSEKKLSALRQGVCPTCGRSVPPEELKREETSFSGLNHELTLLQREKDAEDERVSSLLKENERVMAERSQWETAYARYSQELTALDREYSSNVEKLSLKYDNKRLELQNDINTQQMAIKSAEDRIRSSERLLESCSNQMTSEVERQNELQTEIDKLSDVEKAINDTMLKMKAPLTVVDEYDTAVRYNDSVKVYNEEMRKRSIERDAQVADLEKELENLTARKTMMTVAKGLVQKEFPSYVISRMVESLSLYVNEFLQKVYPKYTLSIEEDKNSLSIKYGEFKTDVKMASGFEKSAFSLAYMYALGKLQGYGLLICDEGDSAASDENSAKFYQMLGRSTDWLEQIMCITHKEDIKELLKNDYHAQVFTVENGVYREETA